MLVFQEGGTPLRRYISLLRGINVGGKNKIEMSVLKAGFVSLGYQNVITFLNSGNIIFTAENEDPALLTQQISAMIHERFGLEIPVLTILQEDLIAVLAHTPNWWGTDDKKIYDNLIFLMPPLGLAEFYQAMGNVNAQIEQESSDHNLIFWSFVREDYQKSSWWSKTAKKKIKDQITIRTANTVRKIANL